jgi:hypothetical protein
MSGDKELLRVHPRSGCATPDDLGRDEHWILEIHLVDSAAATRQTEPM